MRLGCTSYIYPADIITNVRQLAGRAKDIELVLFQVDDHENNLPDDRTVAELCRFASYHDMTYTVHLPLDLGLAEEAASSDKALRVINCTRALRPYGYVIHLDGEPTLGTDAFRRWHENSLRSLAILASEVDDSALLCVENLDSQPGEMISAILDAAPVSCCADVGHLWKQGIDPLPWLEAWGDRVRLVHLHGAGERDHKSLSLAPKSSLDDVVSFLADRFNGVVTIEVFNEKDWIGSLETLRESAGRLGVTIDR